jgi:hypothetical protein
MGKKEIMRGNVKLVFIKSIDVIFYVFSSHLSLICYFIIGKVKKATRKAEKNYNKNIIKRRKRDEDRRICSKKRFDDKDEMNANVVNDMIRSHKDHSIKKK